MKGATGTSLGGGIERGATKRVSCDCWKCSFHRDMGKKTKGKYFWCSYYDITEPRKTCARYSRGGKSQGQKRHEEDKELRQIVKRARRKERNGS